MSGLHCVRGVNYFRLLTLLPGVRPIKLENAVFLLALAAKHSRLLAQRLSLVPLFLLEVLRRLAVGSVDRDVELP
jgi:hypothetical protein